MLLLLPLLLTFSFDLTSSSHNLIRKSIYQANLECYQYLRGSLDFAECGARCQQIVLRAWEDDSGIDDIPYGRHFQPDCADQLYENRTDRCIEWLGGRSPCEDACRRSEIAWQCYRDQHGELTETPQVVPMPDLLLRSTVEQCSQILRIDDRQVVDGNLHLTPAGHQLLRCVIIREGFYSDADGPNLDHLYVQCGGYDLDEEAFKRQFQSCHKDLLAERLSYPTLASRLIAECIPRSSSNQRSAIPSGSPVIHLPAGTSPAVCRITQQAVCATSCNNMAIARQCSTLPIIGPLALQLVLATFPLENGFPLTGPLIQTLPAEVRACIVEQFQFCRANCLPGSVDSKCQPGGL